MVERALEPTTPNGDTALGQAGSQLLLAIGVGKAARPDFHPELLEANLVDERVQNLDGSAQVRHTLLEKLDLLFQLRDALAVRDWRSYKLTTLQASAESTYFCTPPFAMTPPLPSGGADCSCRRGPGRGQRTTASRSASTCPK